MLEYFIKRMVSMVITVIVVSIAAFVVIQLPPGDYLTAYIADQEAQGQRFTDDEIASLRVEFGLDKPMVAQYFSWIGKIVTRGDLGWSLKYKRPVSEMILERLPMTLLIFFCTIVVTYTLAISIGVYSATHQYSVGDYFFTTVGFIGIATPHFLSALVVMYIFQYYLGFDVGGLQSADYRDAAWLGPQFIGKLWDLIKHLVVPVIIIGTAGTAGLIRVMRGTLLDELRSQYVTTARAKGVSEIKLLFKYPVRIACNPIVSTIGWLLPRIISGQAIVAIVLNLPTISPLLLVGLKQQDTYLAGSIILILTCLVVIGTFISDILLVLVDPRIRLEKRAT